jgi:DNA-3-methyladenine glycosylase
MLRGRVVEVEAYLGVLDRAAHTFGGRRTARNESMWLDGGHAYVYFTYGMHWCLNIVAESEGVPTACLIRALEPLEGIEEMRRRRTGLRSLAGLPDTELCSGPAKLTQALGIDRSLDGEDLVESKTLFLVRGSNHSFEIARSARIGVAYAGDWARKPLRFYLRENEFVSRQKSEGAVPPKKRRPLRAERK